MKKVRHFLKVNAALMSLVAQRLTRVCSATHKRFWAIDSKGCERNLRLLKEKSKQSSHKSNSDHKTVTNVGNYRSKLEQNEGRKMFPHQKPTQTKL